VCTATHNFHGKFVLTGKYKDRGCRGEGAIEEAKCRNVCPAGVVGGGRQEIVDQKIGQYWEEYTEGERKEGGVAYTHTCIQ